MRKVALAPADPTSVLRTTAKTAVAACARCRNPLRREPPSERPTDCIGGSGTDGVVGLGVLQNFVDDEAGDARHDGAVDQRSGMVMMVVFLGVGAGGAGRQLGDDHHGAGLEADGATVGVRYL